MIYEKRLTHTLSQYKKFKKIEENPAPFLKNYFDYKGLIFIIYICSVFILHYFKIII